MRSARLRFPLSMSLLVKRATFRLLYLASGTSGRRTALLRLGTICLLINQGTCFVLFYSRKSGVLRAVPLCGVRVSPLFLFPYSPRNLLRSLLFPQERSSKGRCPFAGCGVSPLFPYSPP